MTERPEVPEPAPASLHGRALRACAVAAALALSLAANGCLDLSIKDGFPCSTTGNCPSPYQCVNGTCVRQAGDAGDADARADAGSTDGRTDAGTTDGPADSSTPDVRADAGGADAPADVSSADAPVDSPAVDAKVDSPAVDTRADTAGDAPSDSSTDIRADAGGCVATTDCPGVCQTCSNGACVAVKNQDDTDSCPGTCDATGSCKSKPGQSCTATTGGCISTTTCSADNHCCNSACAAACSGTSLVAAGNCSTGTCVPPAAQPCAGGFVCSGSACKTSCSTNADCLSTYVCSGTTCVPKCTSDTSCATGNYCVIATGICAPKGGVGDACSGNNQCSNNSCADGVCCGTTCNMACQGCTIAHTGQPNGTCAPTIPAMTTPTAPLCAGGCPKGYAQCTGGTACSRISWDFETHPSVTNYDSGNGDWESGDSSQYGADALDYQMMPPGQVHGGQWAARIRGNPSQQPWLSGVQVDLCPSGGSLDLRGKSVTLWFYFDGPQVDPCSDPGCGFGFTMTDPSYTITEADVALGTPQFGHWYQATFTLGISATAVAYMGVQCGLNAWSGTLYMDDVSIQ